MEANGRIIYVGYSRQKTYDVCEGGKQISTFSDYKKLKVFIKKQVAESPGLRLVQRRGIDGKTWTVLERLVN